MRLVPLLALLVAALPAQAADADIDAAKAFIGSLKLGATLQHGDITVVPLEIGDTATDPGVIPSLKSEGLSFSEPAKARQRFNVVVKNEGGKPVYLPGGTVLIGGTLDRLVRHDHLIAPGASAEIRTLPAASTQDTRKKPIPFSVSPVIAPLYLRAKADFGGSNSLVPTFVARWEEFRNEGDERKSLAAFVDSTKLRAYVLGSKDQLDTLPAKLTGPQIVGSVAALHGRVQSLAAFGTNDLMAVAFPPAIKGATYASAAIAIRSKQAKIPLPGRGDPDKRNELVRADAEELLRKLKKAQLKKGKLGEGETGSSIEIRLIDGTRGRVVVLDGKVVHLILYPKDPFRDKLYGRAIKVPDEKVDPNEEPAAGGSSGGGEDLSDDEVRFIERGRRGGRGGGGGGGGGRRR